MIGYLSGTPKVTQTGTLIVCHGVGYAVLLTANSRQRIALLSQVELYIYPHIREDAFDLYGFSTEGEKELFIKLIGVDGVGPKTALSIMDRGVEAIISAVKAADVTFFSSVPRVGKKSAQKIIIDLKNSLKGELDLDLTEPLGREKDIIDALESLGFVDTRARVIARELAGSELSIEKSITQAIVELTKPL